MTRNNRSKKLHHETGFPERKNIEVGMINKIGVTKQWIRHSKLAITPKVSEFFLKFIVFKGYELFDANKDTFFINATILH